VRYRAYLDRASTWRRVVARRRLRHTTTVVALDEVSFDVEWGETMGLVGDNGAGKSTLLRVIARTMRPDAGSVVVNGETSTLLQLGAGFNHELSGRRNVYLSGLAHGLARVDVSRLFDDIVDYAGLGEEAILVWFGIIAVVVTEISLITPPVGLNVFVLAGVLKDVKTSTVFKGVTPFWCADIVRLALLVGIPSLSLFLPRLFYH